MLSIPGSAAPNSGACFACSHTAFCCLPGQILPFWFLEQVPAFHAFKLLLSGLRHRKTRNFPVLGDVVVCCLPGGAEDGLCCLHLPNFHLAGNLGPRNAAGSSVQEVLAHRGCVLSGPFWWVSQACTHGFCSPVMGKLSLC